MKYGAKTYLWDRVWESPCIVIKADEDLQRYTIAEIIVTQRKFGRVAVRNEDQLTPYVKVILPLEEAKVLTSFGSDGPVWEKASDRVREAMERTGLLELRV